MECVFGIFGIFLYLGYLEIWNIQNIWDIGIFEMFGHVLLQLISNINSCMCSPQVQSDLFHLPQRYPDIERLADILEVTIFDDLVSFLLS